MSDCRVKGIDWDAVEDLGVVSDSVIARRLSVNVNSVRSARAVRGIARAPSHQVKPVVMTDDMREMNLLSALCDLSDDARSRVIAYAMARWGSR